MIINFENLDYLQNGNLRQQCAFHEIRQERILKKLGDFQPILAGTIPLDIDLPDSDLDIICHCKDHDAFTEILKREFDRKEGFKVSTNFINEVKTTLAQFKTKNFEFEIFGQDIPSIKQHAYRHLLIEYQILKKKGPDFKQNVIKLKAKGIKTEPAFAKLLNLSGDPYEALLKLEC